MEIKKELEKIKTELEIDNIEIPFENQINKIDISYKKHINLANYEFEEFYISMSIDLIDKNNINDKIKSGYKILKTEVENQINKVDLKNDIIQEIKSIYQNIENPKIELKKWINDIEKCNLNQLKAGLNKIKNIGVKND